MGLLLHELSTCIFATKKDTAAVDAHHGVPSIFRHLVDHAMILGSSNAGIIDHSILPHSAKVPCQGVVWFQTHSHIQSASHLHCFLYQRFDVRCFRDIRLHECSFAFSVSLTDDFMCGRACLFSFEFGLRCRLEVCTDDKTGSLRSKGEGDGSTKS